MATIQNSIKLTDGMSPVLNSILNGLDRVITSFNNLQGAVNAGVNTSSIQATNGAISTTAEKVNRVEQEIVQATSAMDSFNVTVGSSGGATSGMIGQFNQVEREIRQNTQAQEQFNQTLDRVANSTSDTVTGLNRIETEITQNTRATERLNESMYDTQMALSAVVMGLRYIESGVSNNVQGQRNFNNEVKKSEGLFGGLLGKVTALVGAYAGFNAISGAIKTADEMTMTTARLNMMNDGLQTTDELYNKIHQAAMRSRGEVSSMADAVAKLGMRAGGIFKNNEETIAFTETLNKMFVVAGASQAEMASATLQLTQALGAGTLRGEEFNAVFEAAPNVMQAVADYLGKPIGALKELASEGKISAQIVKNALFAATDKVNEQFNSIPYTWSQVWTTVKNVTLEAARPILQWISDITSSERFIEFANGAGKAIKKIIGFFQLIGSIVSPILAGIYDGVAAIFNFVSDNWSLLAPIIWGVVAAMTAYKTATMLAALWSKLFALWEGIVAGAIAVKNTALAIAAWAMSLFTGASFAATTAQWGLNSAMYACPLTWIIIGIIALIAVFYLVIAAVNKFAGASLSATGMICGAFKWMGALIANVFIGIWNVGKGCAQYVVNVWNWAAENMGIIFDNIGVWWNNLWVNAMIVFVKFIDEVIDKLTSIDKLGGWNPLGVAVSRIKIAYKASGGGNRDSIINDLNAKKKEYKKLTEFKNDINWESQEYFNLKDAYNSGYEWGQDKINELQKYLDQFNSSGENSVDSIAQALRNELGHNPALDGIKNELGDIGKDVKGINKTLNVNDEELNYISKLAQRDAINRVTKNEIRVNMTNNNSIKNGSDIKNVAKELARQIQNEITRSAEGVYN